MRILSAGFSWMSKGFLLGMVSRSVHSPFGRTIRAEMNTARPVRFSQAAQNALTRILQSSSIRPGPDMLDTVLLKLELQERLAVSEILLRRGVDFQSLCI